MGIYTILLVAHTILVLFLIIMVLIQRTDSDGLSGLGGGGGGNQFMTGRGAASFMTRTTAILATAFMLTSLGLAMMASHMTSKSIIDVDSVPAVENSATTEKIPEAATKQEPVAPKPE